MALTMLEYMKAFWRPYLYGVGAAVALCMGVAAFGGSVNQGGADAVIAFAAGVMAGIFATLMVSFFTRRVWPRIGRLAAVLLSPPEPIEVRRIRDFRD